MRPLPRLVALATAVPPHRLDQSNVAARAMQLFGRSPDFERLAQVYANSGIECRYSVVPFIHRFHPEKAQTRAEFLRRLDARNPAKPDHVSKR